VLIDLSQRALNRNPEVDLLKGRSLSWIVLQLGDTSDVLDPLSDGIFKPFDEFWILAPCLEVISIHLAPLSLALLVLGFDLWVLDELNVWHDDVLLALYKMDLQLAQISLHVLESRG